MGLYVESDDVHVLLKSHEIEINTEELQHMQEEQQKAFADDDEVSMSVLSSLIRELSAKWDKCSYLWKNIIRTQC